MKLNSRSLVIALLLVILIAAPAQAASYYRSSRMPVCRNLWPWFISGFRLTYRLAPALYPVPKPTPTPPSAPVPQPQPDPAPQPAPQPVTGLSADEAFILRRVNEVRADAGLRPLQVDYRLVETARAKSADMVANGYFGHTSPTMGSPFDQMRAAGISYRYAGENIAGSSTAQQAFEMWMQSSGHRANILRPEYTHIGIGVVPGSVYGRIHTQHFIGI